MASQFSTVGVVVVVRGLSDFQQGMGTLRRQMGITSSAIERYSKNTRSASGALIEFGQRIRNIGNQALILGFQLTFLSSGAMAAVIGRAAQFEEAMVKIENLADQSRKQVGEWADELIRLAPELGKAPSELAEALFFVTSTGLEGAQALDIVEQSAKASSIGMGQTSDIARTLVAALQAYKDTGLTAAQVTDQLTIAVQEGAAEAEELAPTLGRVIGIAANLGVGFDELLAFIATFTRVGVPAEVAVTSLRSALQAIQKPTEASKNALAEYGITMGAVREAVEKQGLAKTLITLASILGDDNEAFAKVVGSARGMAGVFTNTGALAEDYIKILQRISGESGVLEASFDRFTETTAFRFNQLKASLEVVGITVGGILLPGLNQFLEILTPIIQSIGEFAARNEALTKTIGLIVAGLTTLGPLLIIGGLIVSSIGTLVTGFGALVGAFTALIGPAGLIIGIFTTLATTLGGTLLLSLGSVRDSLASLGINLGNDAQVWGENLAISFANGIAAGVGAIIDVLIDVGSQIEYWLSANSPPRLLPDLPEWGASAMREYMQGWLDVDLFDIFNRVSKTISSLIRSLPIDEVNIVPRIIFSNEALAGIVEEFRKTGEASAASIKRFTSAVGASSALVGDYARAIIKLAAANEDLAAAQEEVNRITKQYEDALRPIDTRLNQITRRQEEVRDAMRTTELEQILADPRATPLARELARLELEQIDLEGQKREIEDTRDAELELANARLSAAEEAVALAEAQVKVIESMIEAQTEYNRLLGEQEKLLERLAKAAKDAALSGIQGLGKLLGGGEGDEEGEEGGPGIDPDRDIGLIGKRLTPPPEKGGIFTILELFRRRITNLLTPKVDKLVETWTPVFVKLIEKLKTNDSILATVSEFAIIFATKFVETAVEHLGDYLGTKLGEIDLVELLGTWWNNQKEAIGERWSEDFGGLFTDVILSAIPQPLREQLKDSFLGGLLGGVAEPIRSSWETLFGVFGEMDWEAFARGASTAGGAMLGFGGTFGLPTTNAGNLNLALTALKEDPMTVLDAFIKDTMKKALEGDFAGALDNVNVAADLLGAYIRDTLVNDILPGLKNFINNDVVPAIESWTKKVQEDGLLSALNDLYLEIRDNLLSVLGDLADLLFGDLANAFSHIKDFILPKLQTALDNVRNSIGTLIEKVLALIGWLPFVKVPDAMQEESPSPFEMSLRHIASAFDDLTERAIPSYIRISEKVSAPSEVGASSNTINTTVEMGGQTINSGIDLFTLQILVEQAIKKAVST